MILDIKTREWLLLKNGIELILVCLDDKSESILTSTVICLIYCLDEVKMIEKITKKEILEKIEKIGENSKTTQLKNFCLLFKEDVNSKRKG